MYSPGNPMQPPFRRPSLKGPLIVVLVIFLGIGGAVFYALQRVGDSIELAVPALLVQETSVAGSGLAADPAPADPAVRLVSGEARWIADVNGDERAEILGEGYVGPAYSILVLDGATGALIWSAPTVDPTIKLGYFGDLILTAREREIRAYAPADGAFLWAATLPDKLQIYPFRAYAIDAAVVVQSADNALTSINRQTGAQNWQVTLRERNAQDFQRLTDLLCDSEQPEDTEAIYCYDLKTGAPVRSYPLGAGPFDRAVWWADDQPQNPSLYRLLESQAQPTFERVNADGSVQWAQPLPEVFNRSSAADFTLVSGDGVMALGTADQVAVINMGGPPVIVQQDERELYAIGFDGPILYLAAVKQRGTPTLTFQAIDSSTGAVLNTSPEVGNSSSSLDSDAPRWAILPGQGLLAGSQALDDDDTIVLQLFAADGTVTWTYSKPMFIGSLPTIHLDGNRVLFSTSDFTTVLDARTGAVLWEIEH